MHAVIVINRLNIRFFFVGFSPMKEFN